jgi:ribosomal protein L10
MSKYVKELQTDHLKHAWNDVSDLLVVSLTGLEANTNSAIRRELRSKNIHMTMVKKSLARRATKGTPLAPAFDAVEGAIAVVWGGSDIVALAKEITRIEGEKKFAPFVARGGVMDGAALSPVEVKQVSKWPSREEQLSILVGQILGPGATLAAQLNGPGGGLASQIQQKGEEEGAAEPAAE